MRDGSSRSSGCDKHILWGHSPSDEIMYPRIMKNRGYLISPLTLPAVVASGGRPSKGDRGAMDRHKKTIVIGTMDRNNCYDHQYDVLCLGITRRLGLELTSNTTLRRSIIWLWLRLGLSQLWDKNYRLNKCICRAPYFRRGRLKIENVLGRFFFVGNVSSKER